MFILFGGDSVPVQDNALTQSLVALNTTAGNAVSDLAGVVAGTDVLASQFADVKNALQDLIDMSNVIQNSGFYTPVGALMPFAADVAPTGWYLCNGDTWATLTLSTGNPLYDLLNPLGYAGVPDLRGRMIAGLDTTGYTDLATYPTRLRPVSANADDLGAVIGDARIPTHGHANTISYTQDDHSHTFGTSVENANHTHTTGFRSKYVASASSGVLALVGPAAAYNDTTSYTTSGISANHAHSGTTSGASTNTLNKSGGVTDYTGGGALNVPPTMMLNYIIKG